MENSLIGWTHHTWNPWWGCNKVSPACRHCYIGQIMRRSGHEPFAGPMRTALQNWKLPARWNRQAARIRTRRRVFTCSMSDFFHARADRWRDEAWRIIRDCNHLDWLILTKRPQRIVSHLPEDWDDGYRNVWLGVTVESPRYLERIERLAEAPAAIRFVSAEPLLGPIDFGNHLQHLDWIITGCEKAAQDKRRPMDLDWVREIDRKCQEAGVPHYFKQYYVGKQVHTDGLLDGVVRQEWPAPAV